MNFHIINLNNWPRKTHFDFYNHNGKCAYNLTANIEVTSLVAFLKENNYSFYPAFIHISSKAINKIENFKIRFNDAGELGYWDYVSPTYTLFHNDDKTFSCIYTEYSEYFPDFYQAINLDINEYKNIKGICTRPSPKNCFHTSCIPWLTYTGFSLHLYSNTPYLAPIVTWGRYFESNDKLLLPLTLQAHHAIADGYHASEFFKSIQDIVSNPRIELI